MQQAPKIAKGPPATPVLSLPDLDQYRQDLQTFIYGPIPSMELAPQPTTRLIQNHAFESIATIEEQRFEAVIGEQKQGFNLVLVTPKTDGPVPVIIMQNFCPNHSVIPVEGLTKPVGNYFDCSADGFLSNVFTYFFGRYITTPPIDLIMERGYALAVLYPHELVPDNSQAGLTRLNRLFPNKTQDERPGALGVWSAQFIALAERLKSDSRYSQTITYGHSRFGKTALLAAAFSDDIDGVIAHQSGTGGASLLKDENGESIAQITASYPHWFNNRFAGFADNTNSLPIDSHALLALVAPRPILLGNARRDVWSDPNGAFLAAQAASDIYQQMGVEGLEQSSLSEFNPEANLSFWMRPGTHGVVEEDWPSFLQFLDNQFK